MFEAQADALRRLLGDPSRLHHALLLEGRPGIGKGRFAAALAKGLLCEGTDAGRGPGRLACGRCPSCGWFDAASHPDFRPVGLLADKEGKVAWEISIDPIRDLESFIGLTAFRDGARIVLIDPADALSGPAANALLKMLEEPGERTVFLLVTHRPDQLPATVRSRCRRVRIPAPTPSEAVAWLAADAAVAPTEAARLLAMAGGAPLHARDLADPANLTAHRTLLEAIGSLPDTSLIAVAERVGTASAVRWYPLLQRWLGDLVRVSAGASPRHFPESAARLAQLGRRSSLGALTRAATGLQRQANLVRHPLNPRLFLEESLALYLDAFDNRRGG